MQRICLFCDGIPVVPLFRQGCLKIPQHSMMRCQYVPPSRMMPADELKCGVEEVEEAGSPDDYHSKSRYIWHSKVHHLFEEIVMADGIFTCQPAAILEKMVALATLRSIELQSLPTRIMIKSHLQKYRLRHKNPSSADDGDHRPPAKPTAPRKRQRKPAGVSETKEVLSAQTTCSTSGDMCNLYDAHGSYGSRDTYAQQHAPEYMYCSTAANYDHTSPPDSGWYPYPRYVPPPPPTPSYHIPPYSPAYLLWAPSVPFPGMVPRRPAPPFIAPYPNSIPYCHGFGTDHSYPRPVPMTSIQTTQPIHSINPKQPKQNLVRWSKQPTQKKLLVAMGLQQHQQHQYQPPLPPPPSSAESQYGEATDASTSDPASAA